MKIAIKVSRRAQPEREEIVLLRQVLRAAAIACAAPRRAVTVWFCDDETIRRCNRQYRAIDRATDVLSFPTMGAVDDGGDFGALPGLPAASLGDIIISLPRATEQAQSYGHSRRREIAFLALHGFLHLLGYDHETEAERQEMETLSENILTTLGVTR